MDLSQYNDQQREAVLSKAQQLLILAGAGSGKTRVLTGKMAYLIEEKLAAPWEILAFTFTNKAAKEMRDRLEKSLGQSVAGLWIGTFHSICARILRRDIDRLGYSRDFTIYDTGDQQALIKQLLREGNIREQVQPRAILQAISGYKNRGISLEQVQETAQSGMDRILARLFGQYEAAKKKNNALDFDDLILKAIQLLRDEEVADHYHQQFSHLFVDEYQDTNRPQYDLIRLLVGPKAQLTVVGDADQSIYGWRGADISNILNFAKDYPKAQKILLEQNYRSTQKILDAANQLIRENQNRPEKNLWTANQAGELPACYSLQSEHEEAFFVAAKIEEAKERGYQYSDMAVLYRTNAQSRPFEETLLRMGISYRLVGGLKFYDRAEIKDLVSYMSLAVNSLDDVAFRRIVNQPKRGIGNQTLEELQQAARTAGMSLYQALTDAEIFSSLSKAQQRKFQVFLDILENLKEKLETLSPLDFASEVFRSSGYQAMLTEKPSVENQARLENISSFLDAIATYQEEEEEGSIRDYLQNLSLLSDLDKTQDQESAVNLLTIHSAKGLEFPLVFVVGLEQGLFPSRMSLEAGGLEEERRLMYVAMTRAEKELTLTYARSRRVFGEALFTTPSQFLEEIQGSLDRQDMDESLERENVYDRNYTRRESFANPKLRADYDRNRAAFRQQIREKADQQAKDRASANYRVGDKIRHRKFGSGTVVAVTQKEEDQELTVAFERKGIKRLTAKLAPIEKI